MSKFKKGDLVEVISDGWYGITVGERFNITTWKNKGFKSPIKVAGERIYYPSNHLKKINPDTDEKSSLTFEQLMDKIKSGELEGVE